MNWNKFNAERGKNIATKIKFKLPSLRIYALSVKTYTQNYFFCMKNPRKTAVSQA
jgi:hypothetical protein